MFDQKDRIKLSDLTSHINALLRAEDYASIDKGLDMYRLNIIDDGEVHPLVVLLLVAWLRTTFPVCHLLKNWTSLLEAAHAYLDRIGMDQRILAGLDSDKERTC